MNQVHYPIPPSHKTFQFGNIVIDSNFDSGNCSQAQKVSATTFNIWIGTDYPKNNYRTWFHFSIEGINKGVQITFKIKNMQNQSRLLNQGLVPVFREQSSQQWKRIKEKINTGGIEYNEGWIEWSFKHTMTSNEKVYFAFFYPWSTQQNDKFLKSIQERCKSIPDIYFHRTAITYSLQGRPIQFLTISSKRGISNKEMAIDDKHLFTSKKKPKDFICDKKGLVIGARVHPGEVPSSHVMTGIIDEITKDNEVGRLLRDKLVVYIFPIFNPDGVARGHYRVDTNGINLNRCYINPNPKEHSPIYAVKKVITHLHENNKYFGFLDLHAHASRRGIFIYGNAVNELEKQIDTCLFPKILSMNSQNFQYEGSNFTEKNMYVKERGDHMSKQGSGRVAIFKITKNAYSWTLQCNYNSNRVTNALEPQKGQADSKIVVSRDKLDENVIVNYKNPQTKPVTDFYTIETYRQLGKQICESFLDMLEINPFSRIQNPKSHFKSVQNLRMNLAIALLRMAPNRFEANYKKIYHGIQTSQNTALQKRSLEALYLLTIKKAKISNLSNFLKTSDESSITFPITQPKKQKRETVRRTHSFRPKRIESINLQTVKISSQSQLQTAENQEFLQLRQNFHKSDSPSIGMESGVSLDNFRQQQIMDNLMSQNVVSISLKPSGHSNARVLLHVQQFKMLGLNRLRSSLGDKSLRTNKNEYNFRNSKPMKYKLGQLPTIQSVKGKGSLRIMPMAYESRINFKKSLSKQYFDEENQ